MTEAATSERPYVSESLKSAMRELEDFWNSGGSPLPKASGLGSLESRAASGRYRNRTGASIWEEVKDPYGGVKYEDAFKKLTQQQQVCIRTHFFWSAWTPLCTQRETPWSEVLAEESSHAAMSGALYETTLKSAIAEMERACV